MTVPISRGYPNKAVIVFLNACSDMDLGEFFSNITSNRSLSVHERQFSSLEGLQFYEHETFLGCRLGMKINF